MAESEPPQPLLRVVLFEPEKAGNVGNVARTCALLGAELHLIRPYGFHLSDREFARSVMDYLTGVPLHQHPGWSAFQEGLPQGARVWGLSTRGVRLHTQAGFRRGDYLLFGPESRGLPGWLLEGLGLSTVRLPQPGQGRSLNLAVAVGVAAFEVGRQVEGW